MRGISSTEKLVILRSRKARTTSRFACGCRKPIDDGAGRERVDFFERRRLHLEQHARRREHVASGSVERDAAIKVVGEMAALARAALDAHRDLELGELRGDVGRQGDSCFVSRCLLEHTDNERHHGLRCLLYSEMACARRQGWTAVILCAFRPQDHDIKVQPRPLNIEALSVKLGLVFWRAGVLMQPHCTH